MSKRIFNDSTENSICTGYINGKSLSQLAKEYKCSVCAINGALRRNKVSTRNGIEAAKLLEREETFNEKEKNNIISRYKLGESCYRISTSFNVSFGTVERVLKKADIKTRTKKEGDVLQRKFNQDIEKIICLLYNGGWSTNEIGQHLGCHRNIINNALTSNKIRVRTSKESKLLKKIKRLARLKANGKQFNVIKKQLKEFFPPKVNLKSPSNQPNKQKPNLNQIKGNLLIDRTQRQTKSQKKELYIDKQIGLLRIIDLFEWEDLPDEQKIFIYKEEPLNEKLNSSTYNRFCETYCTKCGRHQFLPFSRLLTHQENLNNTNKECITCMWCEIKKSQDLIGKTYGKWKAIKWRRIISIDKPFKFPKLQWLCLCLNCNKTTRWIDKDYFKNMNSYGEDRGCGCNTRQHRGLYKKIGQDVMTHYWSIRGRAKKNNIPFDLEPEDFIPPSKCPILGIPLIRNNNQDNSPNSPSLDRFYPDGGYVKTNVQFISFKANKLKNNGTPEQWIKLADWCQREDIKHKLSWNNIENI